MSTATHTVKFTRADYMDGDCSHRQYYAQFVTPYVKRIVGERIGLSRLQASRDPHLNDIPLSVWDSFWVRHTPRGGMYIQPPFDVAALLAQADEGNSASTGTCILKEAARQLMEDAA